MGVPDLAAAGLLVVALALAGCSAPVPEAAPIAATSSSLMTPSAGHGECAEASWYEPALYLDLPEIAQASGWESDREAAPGLPWEDGILLERWPEFRVGHISLEMRGITFFLRGGEGQGELSSYSHGEPDLREVARVASELLTDHFGVAPEEVGGLRDAFMSSGRRTLAGNGTGEAGMERLIALPRVPDVAGIHAAHLGAAEPEGGVRAAAIANEDPWGKWTIAIVFPQVEVGIPSDPAARVTALGSGWMLLRPAGSNGESPDWPIIREGVRAAFVRESASPPSFDRWTEPTDC